MTLLFHILCLIFAVAGGACVGMYERMPQLLLPLGLSLIGAALAFGLLSVCLPKRNVAKKRYEYRIPLTCHPTDAAYLLHELLAQEGFVPTLYGTEEVLRSGDGFWVARKFLRYHLEEDAEPTPVLVIEAWVSAGVGRHPNTEYPPDDAFWMRVPKRKLKKTIRMIVERIGT